MADATPRVNSTRLNDFPGKAVRLVGKVIQVEAQTALLEASDQGQVSVRLLPSSVYSVGSFVEVIGKVDGSDNSLQELTSMPIEGHVDMPSVEAVVRLSNKLPDLFPSVQD